MTTALNEIKAYVTKEYAECAAPDAVFTIERARQKKNLTLHFGG